MRTQRVRTAVLEIYEQVRREREVVDIQLALSRLREEVPITEMDEQTYEAVERELLERLHG